MSCDWRSKGGTNFVDEVVYVCSSPHGVPHFCYGYLHLVHFSVQLWYPLGYCSPWPIFSFNATLCPPILLVSSMLFSICMLMLTVLFLVDFPSKVLVLLRQFRNCSCHRLQLLLDENWWRIMAVVWTIGDVSSF